MGQSCPPSYKSPRVLGKFCQLLKLVILNSYPFSPTLFPVLQTVIVYGGAQLALLHFFHFMQQGFMTPHIRQDNVSLILWFHHIHQLLPLLTRNSTPHLPPLNVLDLFLSTNQVPQVFLQYPQLIRRHMISKHSWMGLTSTCCCWKMLRPP